MQVFSSSHTIASAVSTLVNKGVSKLPDDAIVYHPPGTLLEIADEEAVRMVEDRLATQYDPVVHGTDTTRLYTGPGAVVAQ